MAMTVLVTGAASGIGNASARQLVAAGFEVAALDLDEAAVSSSLSGVKGDLVAVGADLSRGADCRGSVRAVVSRFGKLDALIHFAGIHSSTPWSDLGAEEFNRILSVNVTGSFLIAKAAAEHMTSRQSGAIVLTASTSVNVGTTGGPTGSGGPAYVSSKAAITGLVRSLAKSLGPSGVRVNGISPGVVETPMTAKYSPENRALQKSRVPLGRLGQPNDIASVATFLISEASSYINGEIIIVDGGTVFG